MNEHPEQGQEPAYTGGTGMTTTIPHREQAEIVYVIRHPGTGEPQTCDTFEEAMDKWFEGHNIPRQVVNGQVEDFSASYARVVACGA